MAAIQEWGVLLREIKSILHKARYVAFHSVNQAMLQAYFEIGRKIVEEEQKGKRRAVYGSKLFEALSHELRKEFGKGYGVTTLKNMRAFYQTYKERIRQSVNGEFQWPLTWTHYCELIKIPEEQKRLYFEKYAAAEHLGVRNLKRQIYSLHYERLLLSKERKSFLTHENKEFLPQHVEEVIKDPYILEFLNLEEKPEYTEKELETRIINDLQRFLLELGQGFSFVGRQKRITIDNDHFYIDLLLYNIYLKCYVIIDLKVGKFQHQDAGQMNFYLNYAHKVLNRKGDNPPVGIILCTDRDKVQVEFALAGMSNKLFVSKYKLFIPSKEEIEREVQKLI